uniref:Apolipophorin-III n=1 Tax=Thitarodes pui TaxID=507567 RepID=F8R072_THIPU|nr:apolipophorin-III precursor [Thitarodes pui]
MAAKYFIAVCVAAFALSASGSRIARDAPAQGIQLEEIQKNANEVLTALNKNFNALVGVKDNEELQRALQKQSDDLAANLANLSSKLKDQFKDAGEKVQKAADEASTKLNEAVEELKKKNPEVEAKAKDLGEKLKAGFQNAIAESQKVAKALSENTEGIDAKVTEGFKTAYEQVLKGAEDLRARLNEATKKA